MLEMPITSWRDCTTRADASPRLRGWNIHHEKRGNSRKPLWSLHNRARLRLPPANSRAAKFHAVQRLNSTAPPPPASPIGNIVQASCTGLLARGSPLAPLSMALMLVNLFKICINFNTKKSAGSLPLPPIRPQDERWKIVEFIKAITQTRPLSCYKLLEKFLRAKFTIIQQSCDFGRGCS